MNEVIQSESNDFDRILEKVKNQSVDYFSNINKRPTSTKSVIQDKRKLNYSELGTDETLELFNKRFEPIIDRKVLEAST